MPTDELKAIAQAQGFGLVGVCDPGPPKSLSRLDAWLSQGRHGEMAYMAKHRDVRGDPNRLLPGVRSIIAVGLGYYQPRPGDDPKIARYALGRDYHRVIRRRLRPVLTYLDAAATGTSHRVCVDSAPLMEREYAHRAGLGWFGKNTMLINSRRGSWFLLGFVLTTGEWERDVPANGGCGTCRTCIDACPTGAIVQGENGWQVDARSCISYLTIEKRGELSDEESTMIGDWTFGCDICQEVCPFNQPRPSQPLRAELTDIEEFSARTWPNRPTLAGLTEEAWEALSPGSPVRRTGLNGIRRNANANLKNVQRRTPRDDS